MYLGNIGATAYGRSKVFPVPSPFGLGDADSTAKYGQLSATTFAAVAGSFSPGIAALVGLSVPIVGAAIAGITIALTAIFSRKGPKQKELATQAVNQVQDLMEKNLREYLAGPRTVESQTVALANFDQAWKWLVSPDGCGNPALGNPGQRCITERQRGGNIGQGSWCTNAAGCDMFVSLRDPIANDPEIAARQAQASGLPSSITGPLTSQISLPGGIEVSPLVLIGAALVAWGLSKQ